MNAIEAGFIGSDELIRKSGGAIIRNAGKIVATITAAVAILLTFTDVRLGSLVGSDITGELVMMLMAAYLMYFSLADAGEKLGKQTKEYECAAEEYEAIRQAIKPEDAEDLREFCIGYSEGDLEYRKKAMLASAGLTQKQMQMWIDGERTDPKSRRVFKRIISLRAVTLTPQMLLCRERATKKSELLSPERFKICRMAVGLLPTTIGMCITVSVMLTVKDGLSAESVIEGIIKLATLPIVGFRGYATGYSHVREHGVAWLETKTRILRIFKNNSTTQ